jgi:hypothetical protein
LVVQIFDVGSTIGRDIHFGVCITWMGGSFEFVTYILRAQSFSWFTLKQLFGFHAILSSRSLVDAARFEFGICIGRLNRFFLLTDVLGLMELSWSFILRASRGDLAILSQAIE